MEFVLVFAWSIFFETVKLNPLFYYQSLFDNDLCDLLVMLHFLYRAYSQTFLQTPSSDLVLFAPISESLSTWN